MSTEVKETYSGNISVAAPTWVLKRVDQLKEGDLVRTANPPFARVISIKPVTDNYSEWSIMEIQLDASEWQEASNGMNSVFVIVRRRFEAIETWQSYGDGYSIKERLAQVLGWGDFRGCSASQSAEFAQWAKEVGLNHLGNPHHREDLFDV